MKKTLLSAAVMAQLLSIGSAKADTTTGFPLPDYGIVGRDTVCQIFVYSPDAAAGLRLAYLTADGKWAEAGKLCDSDYGPWGSHKKMYNPFVTHAQDGTWRAIWGLDAQSPAFAAAYSDDLVTWRPQDYPLTSAHALSKPVMFQMDDGTFDIYVKSDKGTRYVQATSDFRHFTEAPEASDIDEVVWMRDTATIDGKLLEGNLFDVPKLHLDYILAHHAALADDARRSAERLTDDATRYATLNGPVKATVSVDNSRPKAISDKLIGVFFEDISHAADGGLWAELLENRDFEYSEADHRGWTADRGWTSSQPIEIATAQPLSANNPHYAVLTETPIVNKGFDGITDRGQRYDFSLFAQSADGQKHTVIVTLSDDQGRPVSTAKMSVKPGPWAKYQLVLDSSKKLKLAEGEKRGVSLSLQVQKKGRVSIDMVSLMPQDTYKGHGLRRDLAEAIAALKPRFVRFPGGCMSHGQGLDNIYHWQHTIGPVEQRKPDMNIWNYHQTRALGFYEYFQMCEDMGAEPLPVLAAGVPCQNSQPDANGYAGQQGGIAMADMPAYIDELLHLIEWANGDPATSEWARKRAEAGHPAPFGLKYLGIGNEDIISTAFEERFDMIMKAVKAKYPDIIIVGTAGPFHAPSADYIEGWKFARAKGDAIGLVDEHYYEAPGWFLTHQDYYDDYPRTGPKVYLGEWASRGRTMENALVEAIHLTNVERNADVVSMTSYAPLLAREGRTNWNPDMIYFNNDGLTLTPSYFTQQLWGRHAGNEYLPTRIAAADNVRARLGASTVADTTTGRRYLKLVNALPVEAEVATEGISVAPDATYEAFSGAPESLTANRFTQADRPLQMRAGKVVLPPYTVMAITL